MTSDPAFEVHFVRALVKGNRPGAAAAGFQSLDPLGEGLCGNQQDVVGRAQDENHKAIPQRFNALEVLGGDAQKVFDFVLATVGPGKAEHQVDVVV